MTTKFLSKEDQNKLIGMAFKDALAIYPNLRIVQIGETGVNIARDLRDGRLNVSVSKDGLTQRTKTYSVMNSEFTEPMFDLDEAKEKGIIESIKGWY